jgi:pyruvate dehydrogenase E1 component beta subunit
MTKINFTESIKFAHLKNLGMSKKNIVLGLGMTYPNEGLWEKFKNQVFDTPVSEMSTTGMAVGLASQGFRPCIVHGRVEFAMLAFDQIFTHASRWNYMFGGNYKCPVTFRIGIGRQWGNGPQHTASYHSIFLQSPGLNVFIPSTPFEAYEYLVYSSLCNEPSVFLEHRWLYKTFEYLDLKKINSNKLLLATLYESKIKKKKKYLIITYADGLIESLKAYQYLKERVDINILNISGFSCYNRNYDKIIKLILKYDEIILFDTSPYEFGLLSGLVGFLGISSNKIIKIKKFSPPFTPCPTSPSLTKNYYINYRKIIEYIQKKEKFNIIIKKAGFDELNLWPEFDYTPFKKNKIYLNI